MMKSLSIQFVKITLSVLLLTLNPVFQNAFAAQIAVSLDRNPVGLNESFQIIFTATESPDDDPDFSPLEQDFSILNQSHTSSSSWINGKASRTIQWRLDVMAKNAGSLIVPPINFGSDVSDTTTVLVTQKATNKPADTDEDLFLEVEATPENPYVQSQILYTLRVYTRVEIAEARLNEPELADAVIEKLGEDSNYNTQIKGVDYSVTERKYAIFPQKSGPLTIKPLVLSAQVLADNRRGFNSFFHSPMAKTKRVESKAIQLEVKPVPASFGSSHWLSAQQLDLKQEWSGDLNQMKIGEPLTRTLTLSVKGATVGQLPELNTTQSDDSLKAYPDQPVLQEQKMSEGLTALRQEKIALIPSKAGNYTLPAIEIPWFNTESQKMEIARIPETTLTVEAMGGSQPITAKPETTAITPAQPQKTEPVATVQVQQQTNLWPWLCAFLASGWLVTIVYFVAKRPTQKPAIKSNNVDTRLTDSIKTLKKACANNDAIAAKNALLEWGRRQFNATSLGAIAGFCEARLRDEILLLNQVLYGQEASQWQGKKLFQTFTENKARAKLAVTEDKSLEPLYRL